MFEASYSWRGNNIIRERILRILRLQKMSISIWNEVLLIKLHAIASSVPCIVICKH